MGIAMDAEEFEDLVAQAVEQIPGELLDLVENCSFEIADRAPGPDADLLGVYEGIPLSERSEWYSGVLPDRIVIYRETILDGCATRAEVIDEVRITVWHEIAHFFGIDDERLEELGYG